MNGLTFFKAQNQLTERERGGIEEVEQHEKQKQKYPNSKLNGLTFFKPQTQFRKRKRVKIKNFN